MIEITDADIDEIERHLKLSFDSECREIIGSLESKDVQACPGSGKTTTLVAKLLIFDRKMPLPDGKGICILTHTNVGVEQIKRYAPESTSLFNDPNFCGTIQSFVDRFLAIPAYVEEYGKRPVAIDDEWYERSIRTNFFQLSHSDQRRLIPRRGNGWGEIKDAIAVSARLRCNLRNGHLIYEEKGISKAFATAPNTERYRVAQNIKGAAFRSGILSFDDCYFLAKKYLHKHPELKQLFKLRFPFVFIDEMQDTSPMQMEILHFLFGEGAIMQCFGDTNQCIYDDNSAGERWQPRQNFLSLSTSRRLSSMTSSLVRHICYSPHEDLRGHKDTNISPKILLFDDNGIKNVLPKFAELIVSNKLTDKEYPFKAVGRIGQMHGDPTHLSIGSYFPDYIVPQSKANRPPTLKGHLYMGSKKSPKDFWLMLTEAVQRSLVLADNGQKTFAWQSIRHFIKAIEKAKPEFYEELRLSSLIWYSQIQKGHDCADDVENFILTRAMSDFGFDNRNLNANLSAFLATKELSYIDLGVDARTNEFVYGGNGIEEATVTIHLGTIHSVKGETHAATLFLETFYQSHDISEIIEQFITPNALKDRSRAWKKLPCAYVAMTRPKDMLCVAMRKEGGDQYAKSLEDIGWEIITV